MSSRLALIRQQRAMLRLRSQAQRLDLAQAFEPWHKPIGIVDVALTAVRSLRQHPFILAAAFVALLTTPRHRLTIWAGRLLTGWQIWQMLRHPDRDTRERH